jgi:uncharacterized protein involved in outer membrane biogenesis
MNWLVITIGTALVLALFAAVVGPFFVDWTAYRAVIEAHAERILDTPVSIGGEAEVRLLPRPRLVLENVRIGAAERPLMEADRIAIDVDLVPLFRREVRIADLRIERPTAYVRIEADGAIAVPDLTEDRQFGPFFDARHVEVESVSATDGTVVLIDRRDVSRSRVTGINASGSAGSLQGPFQMAGTATVAGGSMQLQVAGGVLEGATMPLTVRAEAEDATLAFDGALSPAPRAFSLAGRLEVAAAAPVAVAVRGTLTATTERIAVADAVVTYGGPEASLALAGRATVPLASAEPIDVALEARQVDLDRLDHTLAGASLPEGALAPPSRPPREMAERLGAFLGPLATLARPGPGAPEAMVQLDIGSVLAGGSLVRDLSLAARSTLNGIVVDRAEALLPGDTAVALSGRLAAGFSGAVEARASQPSALLGWWTGTRATGTAIDPVILTADVETLGSTVNARRLELRIGDTTATGRARWTGGTAPSLDLALAAPLVDAEAAARLSDAAAAFGAPAGLGAVALDLAVDRLRVGSVEGSGLTLRGDYSNDTLTVDAFVADDMAGARVFASGSIAGLTGVPVGRIEGTLAVADGARLGTAAWAFLDGQAAERLAAVLPALAPADLRFALTGRPAEQVPDLALDVAGTAGAVDIAIAATGAPLAESALARPVTVDATLTSQAPAPLLAALGLGPLGDGEARLAVTMDGVPADGLSATAEVTLGAASARYSGRATVADGVAFRGTASLSAPLVAPLAVLAGLSLPEIGPVDLAAEVARSDGALTLEAVSGTLAGSTVEGTLVAASNRLTGRLAVGELALEPFLAAVLGPDALSPAPAGGGWPVTAFAAPVALPMPADISVTAGRLSLGDAGVTDAAFDLSLETGRIALRNLSGAFAGGRVAVSASLDRDGPAARLAAELALAGAPLAPLVWVVDGSPVATGTLGMEARLTSSAVTVAGLASGLTGSGTLRVEGGAVAADLSPVTVPSLAEAETPSEAAVREAILADLAGRTTIGAVAIPIDIAAGTLRARDVAAGTASGTATLDLGTLSLLADWALPVTPEWTDGRSAVTVRFAGPLASPERSVEVAELTAWLSLRQLERQVETVEAQNRELAAEAEQLGPPAAPSDAPPPVPPFDVNGDGTVSGPAPVSGDAPGRRRDGASVDADGDAVDLDGNAAADRETSVGIDGGEVRTGGGAVPLPPPAPRASATPPRGREATLGAAAADPIAALLSTVPAPAPAAP